MTHLVLVDFDDTLVDTGPRFRSRRDRLFRFLEEVGFDRAEAEQVHHEVVDRELLALMGFGPYRLGPSFRDTYVRLCVNHGKEPVLEVARRAEGLAEGIEAPSPLLPGAMEALGRLVRRFPVAIYTQSHFPDYQWACMEAAGVPSLVPEDRIRITPEKSVESYRATLRHFGVGSPERAWMVGNSMKSDVNPALEAGSRAVWIQTDQVWPHDLAAPVSPHFRRVRSFPEAARLLMEEGF